METIEPLKSDPKSVKALQNVVNFVEQRIAKSLGLPPDKLTKESNHESSDIDFQKYIHRTNGSIIDNHSTGVSRRLSDTRTR